MLPSLRLRVRRDAMTADCGPVVDGTVDVVGGRAKTRRLTCGFVVELPGIEPKGDYHVSTPSHGIASARGVLLPIIQLAKTHFAVEQSLRIFSQGYLMIVACGKTAIGSDKRCRNTNARGDV